MRPTLDRDHKGRAIIKTCELCCELPLTDISRMSTKKLARRGITLHWIGRLERMAEKGVLEQAIGIGLHDVSYS